MRYLRGGARRVALVGALATCGFAQATHAASAQEPVPPPAATTPGRAAGPAAEAGPTTVPAGAPAPTEAPPPAAPPDAPAAPAAQEPAPPSPHQTASGAAPPPQPPSPEAQQQGPPSPGREPAAPASHAQAQGAQLQPASNGGSPGDFEEPATSPESAGESPTSVVTGDLDGDGDLDLAVANGFSNDVTILLNDGSGDFSEPASSPVGVGFRPRSIAVGDLDGDGDLDLAVANEFSADVTILLNDGSGAFSESASRRETAGESPASIVAGDLDGDGDLDLAVVNDFPGDVTILLNDGSGDFSEAASGPEAAGDGPVDIAVGDLDGDGDLDLAVANEFSANVTILLNDGSGDFSEPPSSPEAAGDGPTSIAVGDLDGDGDLDLVVANGFSEDVTILLNDGSGNFRRPGSSPEAAGESPASVVVGDLDGDGDLDLAVANGFSNDVTILLNDGSADFSEPASSPEAAGDGPTSIAIGDLDGDGDLDLTVANGDSDNATILLNQSPAQEPPPEEPPGEQPPGEQPPGEQPPGEQPPGEQPPSEEPPADDPPDREPPTEDPSAEEPGAGTPPADQPNGQAETGVASGGAVRPAALVTAGATRDVTAARGLPGTGLGLGLLGLLGLALLSLGLPLRRRNARR